VIFRVIFRVDEDVANCFYGILWPIASTASSEHYTMSPLYVNFN